MMSYHYNYLAGAHLLDQALTLFGHPSALTAHVLNQRQLPGSDSPDAFTITLHYKNIHGPPSSTTASSTATYPLTAILRASMLARRPGPRFLLHGSLGSFEKHGLDVQEGQLRGGLLPTDPGGRAACRNAAGALHQPCRRFSGWRWMVHQFGPSGWGSWCCAMQGFCCC